MTVADLTAKFIRVFPPEQADVLAEVITESSESLAKAHDFSELQDKKRNGHESVPLMIVHHAREKEIRNAKKKGVIVVQSFEW